MPARSNGMVEFPRPVVWVVGASRGIGAELARQFALIGCHVWLAGRDRARMSAVCREIRDRGGIASIVRCDVTDDASIATSLKTVLASCGRVDVLINNAGITVFKEFSRTSLKELDAILATNLRGPIACVKAVLPSMARRHSGYIINILSNAAVKSFEASAAYTAAKAGMLGFGRVLREETRRTGIRVINVIPGATETGMWSAADRRKFGSRMMRPKSVAEAVLALYQMPADVVPDEIVLRPQLGDIGS